MELLGEPLSAHGLLLAFLIVLLDQGGIPIGAGAMPWSGVAIGAGVLFHEHDPSASRASCADGSGDLLPAFTSVAHRRA